MNKQSKIYLNQGKNRIEMTEAQIKAEVDRVQSVINDIKKENDNIPSQYVDKPRYILYFCYWKQIRGFNDIPF